MSLALDIVGQIKRYWSQKSTGTLFLKLTNGKLVQLFFEKGELQSIKYNGLGGVEALAQLQSMVVSKSQFHEGAISRIVNELPVTSTIISTIENGSFTCQSSDSLAITYINKKDAAIIRAIYTEYVGGLTDLIFDEELEQSNHIDNLINSLSLQMEDLEDQDKFKRQVSAAINRYQ